jgi:hypothetical protein
VNADLGKALSQVLVAGLIAAQGALGDGISATEWAVIALALANSASVWVVPQVRLPGRWAWISRHSKSLVGVAVASCQFLAVALVDGFTADDLIQVVIIAAGAAGVAGLPAPVHPVGPGSSTVKPL